MRPCLCLLLVLPLVLQALRQFGTDFEMLQCLFPGRSRRQMKAKFKKEERLNPDLITYALQHRPSTTGMWCCCSQWSLLSLWSLCH